MKLIVNGTARRTSGSAQPIDFFKKEFTDLDAIVGREERLPFQDCFFCLQPLNEGYSLLFRFGDVRKGGLLMRNQPCVIGAERNVLGVEITFLLEA